MASQLENTLEHLAASPFPFVLFAEWIVAPVRLALLELSIELGLPDIIAEHGKVSAIAKKLGVSHPGNLTNILDAMTATGLLVKENGGYRNGELAEQYLRKDAPAYLGEMIVSLKNMQHRNIPHLKKSLYADCAPVSVGQSMHDEELWKRSASRLLSYQNAGVAERMSKLIADLPGAEKFERMLDLGCGPGMVALRALQRLPQLQAVLCDFAYPLQLAEHEADRYGLGSRVLFKPGDYNDLDLRQDYDLVWTCQSLYYAKDLHEFLKRIFISLNPGGLFVSIHEGMRQENTQPAMVALSRLSLMLEGQNVFFVQGVIATAAENAGFQRVHASRLPMFYGDADFEIFQKPLSSVGMV